MRLLLDSHVLVWAHDEPAKLSDLAKSALENTANEILLSIASAWELQIKIKLGKLALSDSLESVIRLQMQMNALQILPITLGHVVQLDKLASHHKDPFDRLLIAQAIAEDLTIVTADRDFSEYPANTIW